jgi:hypothetical protein
MCTQPLLRGSRAVDSGGTGMYDLFLKGEYEFHEADSREDAGANDRVARPG